MSRVFVFGAGASTEYRSVTQLRVPIDSTFWGTLEVILEKTQQPPKFTESEQLDLGYLRQFLLDRYRVKALKELNENGLETVFKDIYENTPEKIPHFQRLLEWTLFWIIRKIDKGSAPTHYSFVRSKLQAGDTIITFNYDMILDQILWELALENSSPIKWHPSTGYGITFKGYLDQLLPSQAERFYTLETEASNTYIYKLHGSLGWFLLQAHAGALCLYLSGKPEKGRLATKGYLSGQLLLVPPIPNKDFTESLLRVWEQAEMALNKAEKVYFIGYRFPHADSRALHLFQKTCKNKAAEVVLKLMGPRSEKDWEQIANILPRLTPSSKQNRTFGNWLEL
jgi:hypothetical protein